MKDKIFIGVFVTILIGIFGLFIYIGVEYGFCSFFVLSSAADMPAMCLGDHLKL